jgi:hypothetical protein
MRRITLSFAVTLLMPGVGASQTRSDDSARAFHLHGHVVDLAYRAIPDAIVTLSPIGAGDPAIRTKTNPDGNFVLQGPPLGLPRRYELSIRHPSFKTSSQELDIWAERIVNIQMILEVLPYVGVYPLHGSSYDPSPGAPSGLAAAQEPIETTVCDIVKRSAEFNGRVVRFEPQCLKAVTLTTGDSICPIPAVQCRRILRFRRNALLRSS